LNLETIDDQQRTCLIMFIAFVPMLSEGWLKQKVSCTLPLPAAVDATKLPSAINSGLR
jgi:hypothetical protein